MAKYNRWEIWQADVRFEEDGRSKKRLVLILSEDKCIVFSLKMTSHEPRYMSLVGTRPPTLDEFNDYTYYHKKRLSFRPGLTGMWQVSGRNDITDFEEAVKLDIEYIDDWSLLLDIKILLKTLVMAFKGK